MTSESKCVSLETAKKLKDAGFPQDTERYWVFPKRKVQISEQMYFKMADDKEPEWRIDFSINPEFYAETIAAPDAQEIGELLPIWVLTSRVLMNFDIGYPEEAGKIPLENFTSESEQRAYIWMWLKSNNLLT